MTDAGGGAEAGGGGGATDSGGDRAARVRVRGIYATALTRTLCREDDLAVVQASAPIRDRFDAALPTAPADAVLATTDDRQGVGVHGDRATVRRLERLLATTGLDTLTWHDPLARGAVFAGRVTETLGGGAVVDCGRDDGGSSGASGGDDEGGGDGRVEGYLPYDAADDYLEVGDDVRVQVREPAPPWADHRAALVAAVAVENGLARLVRAGSGAGTDATGGAGSVELAQLLPDDPRDGWAVRWDDRADDADLDALADALRDLNDRATALDAALDDRSAGTGGSPGRVAVVEEPHRRATVWAWFGRESRFALDDVRRAVAPTMPGHHRVKAGSRGASSAVDFAEAVCAHAGEAPVVHDADAAGDPEDAYPFGVVARQFGPREGDRLAIEHGKPSGRCITLGRGEVTALDPDSGTATVERRMSPGGTYDALGVERRAGDVAVTKLREGRWWYPTVYRSADGDRRGTYVNVCTPVELFPDAARYVDLHVDVVEHADGGVERVDDDELDAAVAAGDVPEPLAEKARAVASAVERALGD